MAAAAQIALDDPSLEYDDALERAALAIYRAESERPALETAPAETIETPALAPEPIALPVFPHIAARAWRESQGLSRAKLARWIGFSASQIQDYEEGARRGKKKAEEAVISDAAWLRYGLACAALSAGLKLPF
jgi:DNA-binding transcriptional regulator YiaG